MKILYCCRINEHSTKMAGVFKKVLGQVRALAHAHQTFFMYMSYDSFKIAEYNVKRDTLSIVFEQKGVSKLGEREYFWELANQYYCKVKPDFVYARYDQMYDGQNLAKFFKSLCGNNIVTSIEFPTYPYEFEIKDKTQLERDVENRSTLLPFVSFISSTNPATELLGKLNFYFDNKVSDAWSQPELDNIQWPKHRIDLLAVANISDWHAFDRVIRGLDRYYQSEHEVDVHFNLVGDGSDLDKLQSITNNLNLSDKVHFWGFKLADELLPFYLSSDIGIDTLGCHRKHVSTISSLKGREYLYFGLPTVTTNIDKELSKNPYCIIYDSDESALDIHDLLEQYKKFSTTGVTNKEIQEYAKANLTWSSWSDSLIRFIRKI
ncbi:glycosyltransferase [Catenovulum agarivorans]|uniref:glycosyltransferase n=1 Tax=Catenovulum agarivorans TaxID=1172192 RepID=UPI000306510B|nr:glycosyltransferase [Catenovulum agarivorans]